MYIRISPFTMKLECAKKYGSKEPVFPLEPSVCYFWILAQNGNSLASQAKFYG
jgi:hypothetical protein